MSNNCTNQQVARFWASGKDAKSYNGNMSAYASRGFLYSYSTIIGMRIKADNGDVWFIISDGYYSVTTSCKHYSARNRAVFGNNVIALPYIDNIASEVSVLRKFDGLKGLMAKRLAVLRERASKPRIREITKARVAQEYNRALKSFNLFLDAVKCVPLANKELMS